MLPNNPAVLAHFTTFRIGGPARNLVIAQTEDELVGAVQRGDLASTPVLVVSGGSNMLVSDDGFEGTVVVVATQGIEQQTTQGTGIHLRVAAGQPWDQLVEHTIAQGWSGLEMLSGIPGLVGAAPVQNIGAYGAEIASVIHAVRVYDRPAKQIVTLSPDACGFGYRTSLFKQQRDQYVVLSVDLNLAQQQWIGGFGLSQPVAYAELAGHLGVDIGTRVPLTDARQAVLALRRAKGMVFDPADHDTWSAGSFFTNPIVSSAVAATLPEDAPRFAQPDGTVKTSAAWLIDHAGFHKGYALGPAALSSKHVLALTNTGHATAQDILRLARKIRDAVLTTYGIRLEPEPVFVGVSL